VIFHDTSSNHVVLPPNEEVNWRVSAYGITKRADKILMLQAPWDKRWQLPGGGIELDEAIADGLSREYYEETGYKTKVIGSTPFYVGESYFYDDIWAKKFYHSINLFYRVELTEDEPSQEVIPTVEGVKEIEKLEWVSIQDLNRENCHPIIYEAIKLLK
jgi:8-oxo-dGTP pyrophosphatase MutT (NUDIX family)